jgi:myosin heavy chain 9/10/11/14
MHLFIFFLLQDAMTIMGLNEDECMHLYKTLAAILHFGNIAFAQSKRSEYADTIQNNSAEIVSHLLGLNVNDFTKALLRPRIKVANEYTIQGRTVEQVR